MHITRVDDVFASSIRQLRWQTPRGLSRSVSVWSEEFYGRLPYAGFARTSGRLTARRSKNVFKETFGPWQRPSTHLIPNSKIYASTTGVPVAETAAKTVPTTVP